MPRDSRPAGRSGSCVSGGVLGSGERGGLARLRGPRPKYVRYPGRTETRRAGASLSGTRPGCCAKSGGPRRAYACTIRASRAPPIEELVISIAEAWRVGQGQQVGTMAAGLQVSTWGSLAWLMAD